MVLQRDQLSCIKISGYKSIRECDLELKNINVLIGANGSGKSNFISAFSFLQSVLTKGLQLFAAQSGVNSLFYERRKVTDQIFFEAFFGLNSYGFELVPTDDNRFVFNKEFFGYYWKTDWQSEIARGNFESRWNNGVGNNIDQHVIPILEKQRWRVYHFHDTGRNAKVKQEHNLSNNQALLSDAGNLAAFLFRLKVSFQKDYERIIQIVRLAAPFFDYFVLEPQEMNQEQIILKWKQCGSEDVFNASQFSDGTLRFICLATLLLQPKELRPATIIIDEPELGLHPFAITVLSDLIQSAAVDSQLIVSTQSVDLLNEFDAEDVIVANRGSRGTELMRLPAESLKVWLEDDYSLGDLWNMNLLGGRPAAEPV